ncbi:alpha/beta fold hydrolase [Jiangella gansuensis]|uniref:alpha/beta fold hydrolase n=1 Tax=Jiangella gansuensis TaxID=281473 RepID=UPI00047CA671|nr:hypothetical protein [Jiangella gansuensis]
MQAEDRTRLHVGVTGSGSDAVVLSGGPGCVHYLEHDDIAPRGMRACYALDHPSRVRAVVGVAGHGLHKDRTWSQTYEALKHTEPKIDIDWNPMVHQALSESFVEWIHGSDLLRRLADCRVPMTIVAAEHDIRPSWPLRQLAALVKQGVFVEVSGVPYDLWSTHPEVWVDVVTNACIAPADQRL